MEKNFRTPGARCRQGMQRIVDNVCAANMNTCTAQEAQAACAHQPCTACNTCGAYTAEVYSFTHQKMNVIRVSRKYLEPGMKVLVIDDFLANGEALVGLRSIIEQAGCEMVGAGICVEKGFQPGGKMMRDAGVKVVSLAVIDGIEDGKVILRD